MLKLFAFYSQEENIIAKCKGQNLIECLKYTIIEEKIFDNLLPELLLAITHVLNLLLTLFLKNQFLFKTSFQQFSYLEH